MIAWPWLILAFVIGGIVGLLIMAAVACGRESDRMMEARYEDTVSATAIRRLFRWHPSDSSGDSGTGGNNRNGGIQYPRRASGETNRHPTD